MPSTLSDPTRGVRPITVTHSLIQLPRFSALMTQPLVFEYITTAGLCTEYAWRSSMPHVLDEFGSDYTSTETRD